MFSCPPSINKNKDLENWNSNILQSMGWEGACAHARVRCAVARVRVRAKRLLKQVCDVRACGRF